LKFVCYFITGDHISAVCTVNADPIAVAAQELMRLEKMPTIAQLEGSGLQLCVDILKSLQ
jgi:hypothetical protein